ncbi:MAG: DUF3467 domain-containing protein [Candidatus Methanomethylicaceae archaeon]
MAKDKKMNETEEKKEEKPAQTLEELQEQIEMQAKELAKQAAEQQDKVVTQEPEAVPVQPRVSPRRIELDELEAKSTYSNFCYTAGTREGVLFGFGFHDWQPQNPIKVDAKVEMSYFNAKRLLATLNQIIKRHENTFGEIEIDINKRLKVKSTSGEGAVA